MSIFVPSIDEVMQLSVLLFFSNLFSTDMIVIVIVALVLFGGDKLPEIARVLGKGLRDFKEASEGVKREINNQIYAYEEKKQEQRLDETAKAHQEAQATAAGALPESDTGVANTMQFNENAHNETSAVETHIEDHSTPADTAPVNEGTHSDAALVPQTHQPAVSENNSDERPLNEHKENRV